MVDDNNDAADSRADLLRDVGHEVQVAYSPVAALKVVETFRPEVAVLDIGLPVMDGYELAARLRANPVMVRVL
jgi:CheY-like chemotaxis protein